jgi:hypothetical protein
MSLEQWQTPIIPAIDVRRLAFGVWRSATPCQGDKKIPAKDGNSRKRSQRGYSSSVLTFVPLREIFFVPLFADSPIRLVVLIAIASWGQIALSLGTHY